MKRKMNSLQDISPTKALALKILGAGALTLLAVGITVGLGYLGIHLGASILPPRINAAALLNMPVSLAFWACFVNGLAADVLLVMVIVAPCSLWILAF